MPMPNLAPWQLAAFGLICAIVLYIVRPADLRHNKYRLPIPPGPNDKWFVPGPYAPCRKFMALAKDYGPVFSFRQGGRLVCVISGHQAAVDIMQKHGADLADRPRSVAAGEILSGGKRTLLVGAGERLRRLRRALHSHLQPNVTVHYKAMQMQHASTLVLDILRDPEYHIEHARRYAATVIMSMAYGKTTPTYATDAEVLEIEVDQARLGQAVPLGAWAVDRYPLLKYVPFVTPELRRWHREEVALFTRMVDGVRGQLKTNSAQPSFTTYLLEHQKELGLEDEELAYLAGSMFGAGSDTTATAISFMIMAAATHPQAQRTVQAQLDAVVGKDRMPTFEDEKDLPLVTAFYMEAFRWRPVSLGGFAHRATADIAWDNYVIPKGATVIGNHWALGRDPDMFPDPDTFRPSRWLDGNGNIRDDMTSFNFGFGRRVCVGQHVANNSLFINTALLLWAFDIHEDPIEPIDTMGFTDASNVRPHPFKVTFAPRIEKLRGIVDSQSA